MSYLRNVWFFRSCSMCNSLFFLRLLSIAFYEGQPIGGERIASFHAFPSVTHLGLSVSLLYSYLIPALTVIFSRHRSTKPMAIPNMRARKAEKQLPTVSAFPLEKH